MDSRASFRACSSERKALSFRVGRRSQARSVGGRCCAAPSPRRRHPCALCVKSCVLLSFSGVREKVAGSTARGAEEEEGWEDGPSNRPRRCSALSAGESSDMVCRGREGRVRGGGDEIGGGVGMGRPRSRMVETRGQA